MTNKVYFSLNAGFGDATYTYVRGGLYWNYLKALKEARPDIEIKGFCCTHNVQAVELVRFNPYLDSFQWMPWIGKEPCPLRGVGRIHNRPEAEINSVPKANEQGYTYIGEVKELLEDLEPELPKLYLTINEEKQVNDIEQAGRFITIHPFCGGPHRRVFPPKEYHKLIDTVIDKYGYNVAVLGGDHVRSGQTKRNPVKEVFTYQREGLYNLVNKTNGRVCVELVRRCSRFIGNWSCYSSAAWAFEKFNVVITGKHIRKNLEMTKRRLIISKDGKTIQIGKRIYVDWEDDWNRVRAEIIKEAQLTEDI